MKRLSFRDPLSEVYVDDDKIIRKLKKNKSSFFIDLFKKDFYKEMIQDQWIQESEVIIEKIFTNYHIKKLKTLQK